MAAKRKASNTLVWILMGLLIVGLAGFGVTNLGGTIRTVGTVGDQYITVEDYGRELQREIRAAEAQTGQSLTFDQVLAAGIDRQVLARLVALAALDNETDQLGISIGDANLQKEILEIQAFQGLDGQFDREAYRFALNQAGISEAEFETDLRAEAARTLVQGAIVAGIAMPPQMADALIEFVGARRSFTWARLDAGDLASPLPEPTEADLRSYYDANIDAFTLPETKRLTYAWLSPEMMLDEVEVDEAALRQLYETRADEYNLPERRLVERLAFADEAAAASAMAQLEVGGTTFEQLVQDRGLALSDVDLGDVTATDLGDAAQAVFAAEVGDVVGPLPSALGPALFRLNGVLAARVTEFEEARAELQDELASDRARRLIETQAQNFEDLLAGGATLEELASETDMELGTTDWSEDAFEGLAAYDAFRTAATEVTENDFPTITYLEDGGIFALRLDDVLPPRPEPFEEARDRVAEGWEQQATETALEAQARDLIPSLQGEADFIEAGLRPKIENGLTRTAFIDGTSADFMTTVFEMTPGEVRILPAGGAVQIVRLDREVPPEDNAEAQALRASLSEQLNQALSQALFQAFVSDVQQRARPQIDQNAINAVQSNFR